MAFIGHPLVGDEGYNPSCYEADMAIVPRIFLHCVRMEFEDMDGNMFTAVNDLALDLQFALGRIHGLADLHSAPEDPEIPYVATLLGLSTGLAALLENTREAAPQDFHAAADSDNVGV